MRRKNCLWLFFTQYIKLLEKEDYLLAKKKELDAEKELKKEERELKKQEMCQNALALQEERINLTKKNLISSGIEKKKELWIFIWAPCQQDSNSSTMINRRKYLQDGLEISSIMIFNF